MLRSLSGRHGPSLSQSSLELHLSPSSISAANSSITGGSGSASGVAADDGQRSYCPSHRLGNVASDDDDDVQADHIGYVENDGQCSVNSADFRASPIGASIPHLLSTASDDDDDGDSYLVEGEYANPYYERDDTHLVNRGGNRKRHLSADVDRFETMLFQQQQAANNCLDDSVASLVHVDDNASSGNSSQYPVQAATKAASSTGAEQEPAPRSVEDKMNWSEAGKQIRSKLGLSNRSDGATAAASQPIIMLVDLDDNDAELPWMLSQPELERTKIFTSNAAVSSRTLIAPLPLRDEDTLPPHPPHPIKTLPSSRRTNSGGTAASASTSQSLPAHRRRTSSFSSVSSHSSFRSILKNGHNVSRTSEGCEAANKASGQANRTPLMPRSGNRHQNPVEAKQSHRVVSEKENPGNVSRHRGRSLDVADRPGRARRSVSHSEGNRRHNRGARNTNGSQALSSDVKDAKSEHRRTVSFPAELIYKERTSQGSQYHRSQSSPVAAPPPRKYSDDLCLTPLLDMGIGRSRKKAPSHIGNAAEISPRTADFLAGTSPAVAATCEAPEREKYGNSYSHYPTSITRKGGVNYHGVSSGDSGRNTCQPAYQQHQQQQLVASFSGESISHENSTTGRETLSVGMAPKRRFFNFSYTDRKGRSLAKQSSRRNRRFSLVGLLSPVEEGSATGSTACGMTPTPLADPTPVFACGEKNYDDSTPIATQPSFASDGSCEAGAETTVVSPMTNELAKAANVVWGSSSSPSSTSTRSHSIAAVQCQCVIS